MTKDEFEKKMSEIQVKYNTTAAQAGDRSYKVHINQSELEQFHQELKNINVEAMKLKADFEAAVSRETVEDAVVLQ